MPRFSVIVPVYKVRRKGNILGTISRRHFDVFEQYDRAFEFVAQRPERARCRPLLFRRMTDHLATVFTKPGRLPRGARAEFLRRARAHCRRHRAPGSPAPLRSRLRHALALHRTFRALQLAATTVRRTAKLARRAVRALRAAVLQLHYRVQLRLPLRADRAVFAAYWGRGQGCLTGVPMPSSTSRPTPTRPSTWRPAGRPGHVRTA